MPHDPSISIAAASPRAGITVALPWAVLLGTVGAVCGLTLPGRGRAALAGIVSAVVVLALTLAMQRVLVARAVRAAREADPTARVMIPIESLHLGRSATMGAIACGLGAAGFSRRRRGEGAAEKRASQACLEEQGGEG